MILVTVRRALRLLGRCAAVTLTLAAVAALYFVVLTRDGLR
ncbi:hypothetical protein [Streptomyces poonensis]|nr:hypothetical protein [Streptomyces poonensis]